MGVFLGTINGKRQQKNLKGYNYHGYIQENGRETR